MQFGFFPICIVEERKLNKLDKWLYIYLEKIVFLRKRIYFCEMIPTLLVSPCGKLVLKK